MADRVLQFGVPKGSLQDATVELFRRSGWKISVDSRSYFPRVDDPNLRCLLVRAQEMARYVEGGVLDAGITGRDWVFEYDAQVHVANELVYSKASLRPTRWVLVVAGDSPVKKPEDLHGKRIATELVGYTKRWFAERNIDVQIEFSWGATEAKVAEGLVDAIVEVTETGSSLRANRLRIIDTVLESNTQLIGNPAALADPWKRTKLENIALLLKAAIEAQGRVGIMLNARRADLDGVLALLPALQRPTISPLSDSEWVAINTIIEERTVRDLIPKLKAARAQGIVEYPLNKIVM
jgi:ATP phosphoribosyltransferase